MNATWRHIAAYLLGLVAAGALATAAFYKAGDPIGTGRRLSRKTLKLNFWRPGDEYYEHEKEIRFGVPGEVDYEWVYR